MNASGGTYGLIAYQEMGRRESWIHSKIGAGGEWPVRIPAAQGSAHPGQPGYPGRAGSRIHQQLQASMEELTTSVMSILRGSVRAVSIPP